MSRQQVPDPWATAMIEAGLTHNDQPSMRALAMRAQQISGTSNPSVEAVRRMIFHQVKSRPDTVAVVAKAMRVDVTTVMGWTGQQRSEVSPYRPPAEADLLTRRERAALDELIRAVTSSRKESGGSGNTAPIGGITVVRRGPVARRASRAGRADQGG